MRKALLVLPFFVMPSVNAAEMTTRITDSVQLTVDGAAIQTTRLGSTYSVSGSNISVSTLGGINCTSGAITSGSYDINTDGQAFTFSEAAFTGDTKVTSQAVANGGIAAPNLYSSSVTQPGGHAGSLAGTLSATGVPTITAGGSGTTAIGQRTIELSVFQ